MIKKDLIVAVLLTFSLTVVLFQILPISSQGPGDYDPWYDVNDDGKIDMKDVGGVARKFGTSGTNITKASVEYDSDWIDITGKCGQYFNITHNLNTTDIIVEITGLAELDRGIHQKYYGLTGYEPEWWRTFGGASNDVFYSIIKTNDGGYALIGETASFGAGHDDMWLVKVDWTGDLQWNRTYGGVNEDDALSAMQTSDGGYVLVGNTASKGMGSSDVWLVKVNSNGDIQWDNTFGGALYDSARCVIQTLDGGFTLAGRTCSFNLGGDEDVYLIRVDADGNLLWNKTFGGTNNDHAMSMIQTSDGGYAILADKHVGFGDWDVWVIKTDADGNPMWNETYGGGQEEFASSIVHAESEGYAFGGFTYSYGGALSDFWLVKINGTGDVEWSRTYDNGNYDDAECLIHTGDHGYLLGGSTGGSLASSKDFWVIKTDNLGNVQWQKTYGGSMEEGSSQGLLEIHDGNYLFAGWTRSYGAGSGDGWLVKIANENGLTWTDSTSNTITLYRGLTDPYWNYVRVQIWKVRENP